MAQKTEKEETEVKVPESLSIPQLSGSGDEQTEVRSSDPKQLSESRSSSARSPERSDLFTSVGGNRNRMLKRPREKQVVNRCSCSGCKRKLGLMGFRCRCGEMFCSEHRYSDRHNCSYDYKAAGCEAIARENPVVRAPKILKV